MTEILTLEDGLAEEAGSSRQKAPSASDWETYRGIISDMYRNRPLKDVIDLMKREHNFVASAKMYKNRIMNWGSKKNVKSHEMKALVYKIRVLASEGKAVPASFEVDGKTVPLSKVERYARRHGKNLGRSRSRVTSPVSSHTRSRSTSQDGWVRVAGIEAAIEEGSGSTLSAMGTASEPPFVSERSTSRRHESASLPPRFNLSMLSPPLVESPARDSSVATDQNMTEATSVSTVGSESRQLSLETYSAQQPVSTLSTILEVPQAPRMRNLVIPEFTQSETLQHSLLLALAVTGITKALPLADLIFALPDVLEREMSLDINILDPIIELLIWLKLGPVTILLAVDYLCRFNKSSNFRSGQNVWLQLLVALKFAQVYTDDEPLAPQVWRHALNGMPRTSAHAVGYGNLEGEVLSDNFIHLHITADDWKISEMQIRHTSMLILMLVEQGRITPEMARHRVARG